MELVELLKVLVEQVTVNDPERGIKPGPELPTLIRDLLSSWGVPCDVLECSGYYSVYGVLGEGEPVLMFMAHYDTVPADPDEWSCPPFQLTVAGGRGYGRGALDDKGNVAALMSMLRDVANRRLRGTLIYAITGDEEVGGVYGARVVRDLLINRGIRPHYLVNCDGHGMNVIVRRRGAFKVVVEVPRELKLVKGRLRRVTFNALTPVRETRHAAYFMPGVDLHPLIAASYYLRANPGLRVVDVTGSFLKSNVVPGRVELSVVEAGEGEEHVVDEGLRRLLEAVIPLVRTPLATDMYSDYGVSITPNVLKVSEDRVTLVLDVRAMLKDVERLEEAFKRVAGNALPEAEVKVVGSPLYLYTRPNSRLVKECLRVLGELGVDSRVVEAAGASDSRYYSPLGVEAVDFGPHGGGVHGPNEYVELNSLKLTAEFYRRLTLRILGARRA